MHLRFVSGLGLNYVFARTGGPEAVHKWKIRGKKGKWVPGWVRGTCVGSMVRKVDCTDWAKVRLDAYIKSSRYFGIVYFRSC